jgi:hypothetical protein
MDTKAESYLALCPLCSLWFVMIQIAKCGNECETIEVSHSEFPVFTEFP